MRTSKRGLELIKSFEGCLRPVGGGKFKPYICPAGVLTIGWGHTNHHGRKFSADSGPRPNATRRWPTTWRVSRTR